MILITLTIPRNYPKTHRTEHLETIRNALNAKLGFNVGNAERDMQNEREKLQIYQSVKGKIRVFFFPEALGLNTMM
jgi:hypothetical protein